MTIEYGPVAKLVDALDLGSSAFGVRVRVSPGPPFNQEAYLRPLFDFFVTLPNKS